MKRRFRVLPGGKSAAGGGALQPLRLYRAYSIAEMEKDDVTYYGVRVDWYRLDRAEPVVAMESLVADYEKLDEITRRQALEQVLRYLTEEEVWGLRTYLRERHGLEVIAEEVPLPIEVPTGPFHSPYGEVYEFLELSEQEGYALPYRIWGYYSVRGCLSGPNVARGVRFLQKALEKLEVSRDFSAKDLEGVIKALFFEEGLVVTSRNREGS
ncbi:hypothetical protein [Desulfosoma caldarium]|uniref:Uncharacterized protein n=1 Tax=Desulfosoma caldarium TaxID=610254 RepID=A0A3N1VNG0_9BACT|nr:hypothetical protein [Desulfosoma caldarium]ROR01457.1 hypothetical protein EDC27_0626 [Desulfosoma caldarium]